MLYIKNMVCPRCIKVVRDELTALGLHVVTVALGQAVVAETGEAQEAAIEAALRHNGFELLRNKRQELVEKVKLTVLDLIYQGKLPLLKTTVATYLAEELGKDYSSISTTFKALEGVALNRYVVLQKISRARELLEYDELSIGEIAGSLGYSSPQHLSSQFKEVTGLTPLAYKKRAHLPRKPIDNLY